MSTNPRDLRKRQRLIQVVGQRVRIEIRPGPGVPLVLCNGIGALWAIRQPTLIIAGTDDPVIPVINAKIMHRLLPHSTLHLHPGGHVDLVTNAQPLVPVITSFLGARSPGRRKRNTRSRNIKTGEPTATP